MKPRITLAETQLPGGGSLILQEHDGRLHLIADGVEIAGPRTRHAEWEMARIACSPFRPARQPKIWIAGMGLGAALEGAITVLKQKRATFFVAEPTAELGDWHREHFPDGPVAGDPRVEMREDAGPGGLGEFSGTLHAVLLHMNTAPELRPGRPLFEEGAWLAAVHEALQPGGVIAIAGAGSPPGLERALQRQGFETVHQEIDAISNARRPRRHHLWLGRKKAGE